MPSPYVYTFRRRVLMQAVMIAILAAVIGLAALVRHRRMNVPDVPLGEPLAVGLYRVRTPAGWSVTTEWVKTLPQTAAINATDPQSDRQLAGVQHLLDHDTTPESYLADFHSIEDTDPHPITIAGQPGVAVDVWISRNYHQFAVTVQDGKLVLLFHMVSPSGGSTRADRKLFHDVLASVTRPAVE